MMAQSVSATKFVLHHLDTTLAEQLAEAVSDSGRAFCSSGSPSDCLTLAERLDANVVFCEAKPSQYRPLLAALRQKGLRLPVVVVSRLPEVSEWLDALDAGAADYCGAPFEHRQIRWLLESGSLAAARV
jgi:DNA-binding response OmpR family regulator